RGVVVAVVRIDAFAEQLFCLGALRRGCRRRGEEQEDQCLSVRTGMNGESALHGFSFGTSGLGSSTFGSGFGSVLGLTSALGCGFGVARTIALRSDFGSGLGFSATGGRGGGAGATSIGVGVGAG